MMWNNLRRRLAVKLFLSYLIVILIGMVVLVIAVEIAIPSAFQRHMAVMQSMMGGMMDGTGMDMFNGFRSGVNEALALSAGAALLAALGVSAWMSRKVVAPVQAITYASRRIASGHYNQRVDGAGSDPQAADELAQLAQAFNQMAEQLEHVELMRSQLLGDVSHELRTPLTAIKGSMEALIDGVLPAEPATFQQIEQEADRLQRLVNDLQELSRVEAGAYELIRLPIHIESLVMAAIKRLEQQFQQKNITLMTQISSGLPTIQGDQDRLLQVLINLLNNARQYTAPGGTVRVTAGMQGDDLIISVQDNGIGIPAEHIPQLFTRFYRVDKSRSRLAGGGSGIGLTIAKLLIEAHGGRIWAKSAGSGMGSTFAFTLPVHNP
jgi:histidine kinase